jgi:hypothetical protein
VRLKIIVHINAEFLGGQILDVTNRREDGVIRPEILIDRLGLGGRFYDY